jgi:hypothetical protein
MTMPPQGFECSIAIRNSPKTLHVLDHAFIVIYITSAGLIAINYETQYKIKVKLSL